MTPRQVVDHATELRLQFPDDLSDRLVIAMFADAERIARAATTGTGGLSRARTVEHWLDRALTHRIWGFAVMGALLIAVFWITIAGAAWPSNFLFQVLVEWGHPVVHDLMVGAGLPNWIVGPVADGAYLGTAWVIAVMLPPMAIFFPLFALLEDVGYLPRVAFDLDRAFQGAGAHGKQALSMMMGFGCNAAGVTATRIIDSPRERLIAIITNNFSICNGRWPTLILMGTIFIGATVSPVWAGLVAALAVVAVAVLGMAVTIAVSWGLSRSVLRGELSVYSLELPPYRRPQVRRTVWNSLVDRTAKVLRRAVVMAAPAGVVIWLLANVEIGGTTLAAHLVSALDPIGLAVGLNGVILAAYIVAIPANEIVMPAIILLTLAASEGAQGLTLANMPDSDVHTLLVGAGGWTLVTAINLMLFSLLHNPCSTTMLTIWHETGSLRWTTLATVMPIVLGLLVTTSVAGVAELLGSV